MGEALLKVLLVDDEPFILQGLKILIDWEQEGFEVVKTAANGEEALEYLRGEQVDLIIADIKMPVVTGLELLEKIRGEKISDAHFVILSGYADFESLGFSLLNACLRVSQQRNEVRMKQKPTCYAGGVKSLYRKTPFRYNRVVQSLLQERKGVLWRISLMISPIQNGCVNTILYLLLSIDEKLFIIN